jgi:hypothetical protein
MVETGRYLVILLTLAAAVSAADLRYWIEPCTKEETGCRAGDPDLAQWAMEAWQAASDGKLKVTRTSSEKSAEIRFHWIMAREGLYGETQGGDVYVRPEPGDGLLRDAIVYLTCVHEAGHALGLRHTAEFQDIMYNFQYGGDITEYFGRYRRKLMRREDIRRNQGISDNDRKQLSRLY